MEVVVEDRQLSLAIGKKGQNVRLAAKLTGWKIDIKSDEDKRKEVELQLAGIDFGTGAEAVAPLTLPGHPRRGRHRSPERRVSIPLTRCSRPSPTRWPRFPDSMPRRSTPCGRRPKPNGRRRPRRAADADAPRRCRADAADGRAATSAEARTSDV